MTASETGHVEYATDPETVSIPDGLSSSEAKLVYLSLSVRGRATVDELAESLGLRKLALYSILGTLYERDFVERDGEVVALTN